jgi:hypothetical protein
MEELLNKLIEKGWTKKAHHLYGLPNKPFVRYVKDSTHWVEFYYYEWRDNEAKLVKIYSLRDIVSKESWLWQFVCENDLLNIKKEKKRITPEHLRVFNWEYQYRLIESALCDEDKLESFILGNIKIDD